MSAVADDTLLMREVRENLDNAKANGHDVLSAEMSAAGWTDEAIADDMDDCAGIFELHERADVITAIAIVRKERTA